MESMDIHVLNANIYVHVFWNACTSKIKKNIYIQMFKQYHLTFDESKISIFSKGKYFYKLNILLSKDWRETSILFFLAIYLAEL